MPRVSEHSLLDAAGIGMSLVIYGQTAKKGMTQLTSVDGFFGVAYLAKRSALTMERVRKAYGTGGQEAAWGSELPHPYDAWDFVAKFLLDRPVSTQDDLHSAMLQWVAGTMKP